MSLSKTEWTEEKKRLQEKRMMQLWLTEQCIFSNSQKPLSENTTNRQWESETTLPKSQRQNRDLPNRVVYLDNWSPRLPWDLPSMDRYRRRQHRKR